MTTPGIHRIIEQHAAVRGNLPAIVDGERTVSYRQLNYAANGLARALVGSGFRRGCHVTVTMPVGADLATVLLAVLKAGGSYTWRDALSAIAEPVGVSFPVGSSRLEERHLHLDVAAALGEPVTCSPNLPIISRGTDTACILEGTDGSAMVMVPHETVATLRSRAVPHPTPWVGEPGAFDLWIALMAGTTAIVESRGAAVAA